MPALVDHNLDVFLSDQVEYGSAQHGPGGADDAVPRPGGDKVRLVREMGARILVVVPRGDHERVLGTKMTQVTRHLRNHDLAAGDRQAAALYEVVLEVHGQQRV